MVVPKGFTAQLKSPVVVDLSRKQSILGLTEPHAAVEIPFRQHHGLAVFADAAVNQATIGVHDCFNHQRPSIFAADVLTHLVLHPAQRCIVHGVQALLAGSGKNQPDSTMDHLGDQSQSQF